MSPQEIAALLEILDASPSKRTREHANELRAKYARIDLRVGVAMEAANVLDRFDALTDEEILDLGGLVVHVNVCGLAWSHGDPPIAQVRLAAFTRRQAQAQLERVRSFVEKQEPCWYVLEKEAAWLVSAFGPEPAVRPRLRLVSKEVP